MTIKYFYAFRGQLNTTTGQPNTKTGRLSTYGDLKVFDTRKERDCFVNDFEYGCGVSRVSVNVKSARKYFLGLSVIQYDDYINNITYL